jgi:hypothetical protein
MRCPNIESEPRTQTFIFHTHPNPLCVSAWVKLHTQRSCDEPKKSHGTVDLTDFLVVCAHKKICVQCYMNTVLGPWRHHLGSWTCVFFKHWCDKEGRNLLTSQELIGIFHMCGHDRTWPTKSCFRTRRSVSEMEVLFTVKDITDLGVRGEHIPLIKSWSSRFRLCDFFLLERDKVRDK